MCLTKKGTYCSDSITIIVARTLEIHSYTYRTFIFVKKIIICCGAIDEFIAFTVSNFLMLTDAVFRGTSLLSNIIFFSPPIPPHVLCGFRGLLPGHGRSVTYF